MQLIHLEVWVAIIETGTLSGAAKRLRMAPSRVTERLQELERELNTTLLDRSSRSNSVTQAGHALTPRAQVIASELATIRRMFPESTSGVVRVGIRSLPHDVLEMVQDLLVGVLGRAGVSLLPLDPDTQLSMLRSGALDCGIIWSPPPPDLEAIEILRESLAVVLPATQKFTSLTPVRPSDLAGLRLASPVDPRKVPARIGDYLRYLPHVDIINATVADSVYLLVSGGNHCAIVPASSSQHALLSSEARSRVLIRPFPEPVPTLRSYFTWRTDTRKSVEMTNSIQVIRQAFPRPIER